MNLWSKIMDIIKKIDSIVEAKKCPEGQKW